MQAQDKEYLTLIHQENSIDELVERFKIDGYIILKDVLPDELINSLYSEYMKCLSEKVRRFGLERVQVTDGRDKQNDNVGIDFRPEGGNHDLNRWNMHLPSRMPFMEPQVISHPTVTSLLEKIIGESCCMYMMASDTPYPGAGFQSFHQDFHRMALTVNIPLVDFTEENAPLEVLPGTHRKPLSEENTSVYTEEDVWLSEEQLKSAVGIIPSKRLLLKAGSILIRDQRLVHRGTAHQGDTPRPALSLWVKAKKDYNISKLNIPLPHRKISNLVVKLALKMRQEGRGKGSIIQNRELVNLGNLLGRLVDEISGTDRDYRRVIPWEIWETLPAAARNLLRYAEVEPKSKSQLTHKETILGSLFLLSITVIAIAWWGKIIISNAWRFKSS